MNKRFMHKVRTKLEENSGMITVETVIVFWITFVFILLLFGFMTWQFGNDVIQMKLNRSLLEKSQADNSHETYSVEMKADTLGVEGELTATRTGRASHHNYSQRLLWLSFLKGQIDVLMDSSKPVDNTTKTSTQKNTNNTTKATTTNTTSTTNKNTTQKTTTNNTSNNKSTSDPSQDSIGQETGTYKVNLSKEKNDTNKNKNTEYEETSDYENE